MLPTQTTNSSSGLQGSGSAQGSTPGLQPVRPVRQAQGLQPQSDTSSSSSLLFQTGSRQLKVEVARGQSSGLTTAPVVTSQLDTGASQAGVWLVGALIFGILAAIAALYYHRRRSEI